MPQRDGYENSTTYVISLALVFTIFVGALRLWIRKTAYGRDDLVIGAATLVAFGRTGANYACLSSGLGKSWSGIKAQGDLAELNEASVAGIVLFLFALYLSKCAMVAFLSRITKAPSQILFYHICTGIVGLLGLVSILTAFAGCTPKSGYYWAFSLNSATCPHQDIRWQAITGLDVLTEALLLVLPIHLVWNLQMPRSKKVMIVAAFWVRLPALGFSIGRNYYTMHLQHPQSDIGLDGSLVTIWLELELAYAIGASTLSALKSFTESVNTGFGLGFTRGKGESYGMSNVSSSTSKAEKAQSASASQNDSRRAVDPVPESNNGTQVQAPLGMRGNNEDEAPLKLRPETAVSSYTSVRAEPSSDNARWRPSSTRESDGSGDDMVIVRQDVYEVHACDDEDPILRIC